MQRSNRMNTENSLGMEVPNWYILLTKPYGEIFISERLNELEIDHFLPLAPIRVGWEKKIVNKRRVIIPRVIFVHISQSRLQGLSEQLTLCVMSSPEKVCCSAWEIENLKFFFSELISFADWSFEFGTEQQNGTIVTLPDGKMKGLKGYMSADQAGVIRISCCGLGSFIVKNKI